MNGWKKRTPRWWCTVGLGWLLLIAPAQGSAAVDPEDLASRIADSLKQNLTDTKYQTVAISRIKQVGAHYDVEDLIDFTNVKIVRGRRLRVIDRSKLELILNEQQVQLSDFVSAQKYQELGKLTGVDIFIYGTFYKDALVMKGIDVQNSAIVWAEVFPLTENPAQAAYLQALGQGMVQSLEKDLDRLQKARIQLVSFWDLETDGSFSAQAVMDFLSVAITKKGDFKVVDRENIKLITKEQQLNQAVFIDEKSAKQLGELYGVDAFIYGAIKRRRDGTYLASLKMLNIYNGVIEWADLIRMGAKRQAATGGTAAGGKQGPPGMVLVAEGAFLMGVNKGPRISQPLHRVKLSEFFIDETEVSNAEYEKFVKAKGYRHPVGWVQGSYPAGLADHPVVGVNWEDARRFCAFVGKRLPSEAEWEKAARGSAALKYPWGSEVFSPSFTVTRESGRKASVPAHQKTRDLSPYRVKHLAGNVREWVQDSLRPYRKNAKISDARIGRERVVRGGSWATDYRAAAGFHRGSSNPRLAWQDLGFRCAR